MATPRKPVPSAGDKLATPKKERLFYSPDGTDIRVCHADGSVAVVGEKPRPLPPKLWKQALKDGCYSTDTVPRAELEAASVTPGSDAFQRREAIKDAIEEALEAEEGAAGYEDAFTANGTPHVRWIEKKVGFGIDAAERDEVWGEIQRELDSEEEQSEGDGE